MSDELILGIIFPTIVLIISFMGKIKTYWRNKAANAFFVVGQHAKTKEERIWGYRNSLLAGNEKIRKILCYSQYGKLYAREASQTFSY